MLCLQKYREELDNERLSNSKIIEAQQCASTNMYINKEYEWAVKMINKVDKL